MVDSAEHFEEALTFLEEYRSLVNCHLVDFITKNLWETCLPSSLRHELESAEFSDSGKSAKTQEFKKFNTTSKELNALIERANSLSLKNSRSITKMEDLGTLMPKLECPQRNDKKSMSFMSEKKQHEIEVLTRLVGHLAGKEENSLVIDAGAGKGYLSTSISQNYGLPVLAIDSSETNVRGAINRQQLILKRKNEKHISVCYSVQRIDENTNYQEIIKMHYPNWRENENCVLTGLHTCGQLAHSMIRNFLEKDCLKCLCMVACCYHLTEESLTGKSNFSKNARMIAQQSTERSESKDEEYSHSPSLFYRALLQIILQSLDIPDAKIGRGAPTQDFPTYARWALKKINVDPQRIPTNESLIQLHRTHSKSQWKFNLFQSIRIHLGSVVEAAIVLDRFTYIWKSNLCSKIALIKLFDPLISPRCYAIVALK